MPMVEFTTKRAAVVAARPGFACIRSLARMTGESMLCRKLAMPWRATSGSCEVALGERPQDEPVQQLVEVEGPND